MQEVYIRHASLIQLTKTIAVKMALLIEPADSMVPLSSRLVPRPQAKESWTGPGNEPRVTEEHLKLTTKWLPICVHVCMYTVHVHAYSGLLLQSMVRKIGSL